MIKIHLKSLPIRKPWVCKCPGDVLSSYTDGRPSERLRMHTGYRDRCDDCGVRKP